MWSALKSHPIPIVARFEYGLALTYAFPPEILNPLLPPGLELDTFAGHGFLSVVTVRTRELRPAFLPKVFGRNFCLTSYRLFTRFKTKAGEDLRGLQTLRNDTDNAGMVVWGNRLTRYGYRKAEFAYRAKDRMLHLEVKTSNAEADLQLTADISNLSAALPEKSPFPDIETALRFTGPLPLTFDYDPDSHSTIVVEARRANWRPQPITVKVERIMFLQTAPFKEARPFLANAFYVSDVPYRWARGRRVRL